MVKKKSTTKKKPNNKSPNLYKWNITLMFIYAVQGIAILVLSQGATYPITVNYLTTDTLATQAAGKLVLAPAMRHLFDVRVAWLVATLFFVLAIVHLLAGVTLRKRYDTYIQSSINPFRWIAYGVGSSLMLAIVGLSVGAYDVASLSMVAGLGLLSGLAYFVMENYNQSAKTINWLGYIAACLAGVFAVKALGTYIWGTKIYGSGNLDGLVYGVFASLVAFITLFAVNIFLSYRRKGRWADYMFGERVYMTLGLVASTTLAWQVFFDILRP